MVGFDCNRSEPPRVGTPINDDRGGCVPCPGVPGGCHPATQEPTIRHTILWGGQSRSKIAASTRIAVRTLALGSRLLSVNCVRSRSESARQFAGSFKVLMVQSVTTETQGNGDARATGDFGRSARVSCLTPTCLPRRPRRRLDPLEAYSATHLCDSLCGPG